MTRKCEQGLHREETGVQIQKLRLIFRVSRTPTLILSFGSHVSAMTVTVAASRGVDADWR